MSHTARRQRERGAVAIFVAILATVLMAVAALAVDLGNAWARKRDVQTQVDVSALSAGHLLPATTPAQQLVAAIEVAKYLTRANNKAIGQSAGVITGLQLLDGSTANGEVTFANAGKQMRVLAPNARVNFGFAGVIGFAGTDVQASATVEIQQPIPRSDVFPFAIPSGCPYGPGIADTEANGQVNTPPSGTFTPTNGDTGSHTVTAVLPDTVASGSTANPVAITLGNLPNNSNSGTIEFRIGATTIAPPKPVSWATVNNSTTKIRVVNVSVGTEVTATSGTWAVWARTGGGNKYSVASQPFTVLGAPAPPPTVGCTNSMRGNFGQLQSPRSGSANPPDEFALNIAVGLDHLVVPFVNAPANDCGKNNPIAGAVLDRDPITANPNCLHVDNGNDGPKVMDGLVTGVSGTRGRLDSRNGTTRTNCGSNGTINGVSVNNDRLSCFLRNGATLAQLALGTGVSESMLDPLVVDSPRFVWIPVFYSVQRSGAEFQPILRFVPAFITDETQTTAATVKNGVEWQSNSVKSIQVYTFNAEALPIDERDPTTIYDPTQRSIVRLID